MSLLFHLFTRFITFDETSMYAERTEPMFTYNRSLLNGHENKLVRRQQ